MARGERGACQGDVLSCRCADWTTGSETLVTREELGIEKGDLVGVEESFRALAEQGGLGVTKWFVRNYKICRYLIASSETS
jgi:hypothetical protein